MPAPTSRTRAPRPIGASATRRSAQRGSSRCHPHGRDGATEAGGHDGDHGSQCTAVAAAQPRKRVSASARGYLGEVTDLTFRGATVDDVDALVALVTSAYRGEASTAGWTSEDHLLKGQRTDPAMVEAAITDPDGTVLLAERNGVLLACIQVSHAGPAADFGMFAVDPTRQAGGVGSALLTQRRGPGPGGVGLRLDGPRGHRPARPAASPTTSGGGTGAPARPRRSPTATTASASPSATTSTSWCSAATSERRCDAPALEPVAGDRVGAGSSVVGGILPARCDGSQPEAPGAGSPQRQGSPDTALTAHGPGHRGAGSPPRAGPPGTGVTPPEIVVGTGFAAGLAVTPPAYCGGHGSSVRHPADGGDQSPARAAVDAVLSVRD